LLLEKKSLELTEVGDLYIPLQAWIHSLLGVVDHSFHIFGKRFVDTIIPFLLGEVCLPWDLVS
jgi:hypothetical protein